METSGSCNEGGRVIAICNDCQWDDLLAAEEHRREWEEKFKADQESEDA